MLFEVYWLIDLVYRLYYKFNLLNRKYNFLKIIIFKQKIKPLVFKQLQTLTLDLCILVF